MPTTQVGIPLVHVRLCGNIGSGKSRLVEELIAHPQTPQDLVVIDEPMELMKGYLKMYDNGNIYNPIDVQLAFIEFQRVRDTHGLERCQEALEKGMGSVAQLITVRGVEDTRDIFTKVEYLRGRISEEECNQVGTSIVECGGVRPCQGLIWIACGNQVTSSPYRQRLRRRNQCGDKFALMNKEYLTLLEHAHQLQYESYIGAKLRLDCNEDHFKACKKIIKFMNNILESSDWGVLTDVFDPTQNSLSSQISSN